MDETILGIPKVAVYFVLAIVLPIIIFVGAIQYVVFTSVNKLADEQAATNANVRTLFVSPSIGVSIAPTIEASPTATLIPTKTVKTTKTKQVK